MLMDACHTSGFIVQMRLWPLTPDSPHPDVFTAAGLVGLGRSLMTPHTEGSCLF